MDPQYLKDKEEIMKRFSEILDESYLNLIKTGKFVTTEIGKETGKMIHEFGIKKKFTAEKKKNSLFGSSSPSYVRSSDLSLSLPPVPSVPSAPSSPSYVRSCDLSLSLPPVPSVPSAPSSPSYARSCDLSLSLPLYEVSSSVASAASTARSSCESSVNNGSVSYRSSKGALKNLYNNIGTIFAM
jgi:hypothetical protein